MLWHSRSTLIHECDGLFVRWGWQHRSARSESGAHCMPSESQNVRPNGRIRKKIKTKSNNFTLIIIQNFCSTSTYTSSSSSFRSTAFITRASIVVSNDARADLLKHIFIYFIICSYCLDDVAWTVIFSLLHSQRIAIQSNQKQAWCVCVCVCGGGNGR